MNSKPYIKNEFLIAFRKAKRWSQTELAGLLCMTQGGFADIERGKANLTEAHIKQLILLGFDAGAYWAGNAAPAPEWTKRGVPLPADFAEKSIEIDSRKAR